MKPHVVHQRGAILVMTVIFLVILLGFAALALDLGRLYVLRTEMQNAADASAMAAAAELDGQLNARSDAVLAAKQLLQHRGRFATEAELLKNLKYDPTAAPEDNAFEFYSWINAELDNTTMPSGCIHPLTDTGVSDSSKCLATGDDNAHYIKVKLYPELVIDEKEYYQISLYFLPVLGLFVEDGTALTASTRVSAVAGAGASMICNYPPIFICSPVDGAPDGGMTVGQQVRIKMQKDSWLPGNFGFLEPPDITDPINGHTLSGNQALAAALANEKLVGCTPSVVTTEPGNMIGWTRDGLNTRFGIYNAGLFMDNNNPHPFYAAAPNVINYPRDREFEDESGNLNMAEGRFGRGWDFSVGGGLPVEQNYVPSTYNQEEYFTTTQPSAATWPPTVGSFNMTTASRYNFYQWELSAAVTTIDETEWLDDASNNCDSFPAKCPSFNVTADPNARDHMYSVHPNQPPPVGVPLNNLRIASSCKKNDPDYADPKNSDCTLLDGRPRNQIDGDSTNDNYPIGSAQKRILYVAMVDCQTAGMPLHGKTSFDVLEHGRFIKMFLTEHIQPPGGGSNEKTDVYAEYLGEVSKTDEKYQDLVHTAIQLYE